MALFEDFKKFAFKGNVVDLAVGVVIGGAFQKIITALVADCIMPFVALLTPAGDWREAGWKLRDAPDPKNIVSFKYGDFVGSILDFFIVAFVLFLIVSRIIKAIEGKLSTKEDTVKECPFCLDKIPAKATKCKSCTSDLTEKHEETKDEAPSPA